MSRRGNYHVKDIALPPLSAIYSKYIINSALIIKYVRDKLLYGIGTKTGILKNGCLPVSEQVSLRYQGEGPGEEILAACLANY